MLIVTGNISDTEAVGGQIFGSSVRTLITSEVVWWLLVSSPIY